MKFIATKDAGGNEVKLHVQDSGKGSKTVILIHGWPLDHSMWDYQAYALTEAGYRVVSYDRRGFGHSDKPTSGYDYDTLAADLKAIIDGLGLSDVILAGFSMGGGEVVRYCSRYNAAKVAKIVLVSAITPYMLQTADHPEGVPQEVFDGITAGIKKDRAGFLAEFNKSFFGVNKKKDAVSQQVLDWSLTVGMQATLKSTLECAASFSSTDFRNEMGGISVPALIIHGDADQTVPFEATGKLAAAMIPGATLKVYKGEPHGLYITSKDELNKDLIAFIG